MGTLVGRVILGQKGVMGTCMGKGRVLVEEPGCQGGWHPPGKGIGEGAYAPG